MNKDMVTLVAITAAADPKSGKFFVSVETERTVFDFLTALALAEEDRKAKAKAKAKEEESTFAS